MLTTVRLSSLSRPPLSTWAAVPAGPPDPILGITEAFKADQDPRKINLGVGAYRDENGKPYVLNAVKKAEEKIIAAKQDKEYLAITGLATFTQNAAKLAYGVDSEPLKQNAVSRHCHSHNRVISSELATVVRSPSRNLSPEPGALRIGGAFMARHYPHAKIIYLPTPTWGNHMPLFRDSGLEVRRYRYFDSKTVGLDFAGMKEDLKNAPEGAIVLLHACAHNPTGVDPTQQQWKELSDVVAEKKLFPFFDMAYQGFASGSTTRDAFAVRHFVSQGHHVALCQSFAKNMGLYGERVEEKKRIDSQIKIIIRPMYSNPPLHGAHIANTILSDPDLYQEWEGEVKGMADRIINMRERLYDLLTHELRTPGRWGHIKSQIGMFSFTGLKTEHCRVLAEKAHIYMTMDGRYFAQSVDAAVRGNL
ncbi:pyridoxal phosphate-dependent transferase [Pisolithus microcarpus]|nr:pyridoxal phosphate-dependent transferase [Pisolithus microcarpus]